jgi:hypothetical protein
MPRKDEKSFPFVDEIAAELAANIRPSGSRAYPDAEQRYAAVTGAGYDLGKKKKSREGDIGRTSMKDFGTGGSTTSAQRASAIRGAGYDLGSTGGSGGSTTSAQRASAIRGAGYDLGATGGSTTVKMSSAPHPKPFGAMTGYMSMNQPVKRRKK